MQTLSRTPCTAPALRLRRSSHTARPVLRRGNPLIGEVNDPERSKQQIKDKKESKDSQWATPTNNNPIEKRTVGHDAFVPNAGGDGEGGKDVLEKVKESGKDVVEGIKETVGGKKDE